MKPAIRRTLPPVARTVLLERCERTWFADWLRGEVEQDYEMLPWCAHRRYALDAESRGWTIAPRRNDRVSIEGVPGFEGQYWDGLTIASITFRVWHDGSVSVEDEVTR